MVLIKKGNTGRKIPLEKGLDLAVGILPGNQTVSSQDSASISIHNKGGLMESVKQNAVGRLRADAGEIQQLLSETNPGDLLHSANICPISVLEITNERLEPFCLLIEISGGADLPRQTILGDSNQPGRIQ